MKWEEFLTTTIYWDDLGKDAKPSSYMRSRNRTNWYEVIDAIALKVFRGFSEADAREAANAILDVSFVSGHHAIQKDDNQTETGKAKTRKVPRGALLYHRLSKPKAINACQTSEQLVRDWTKHGLGRVLLIRDLDNGQKEILLQNVTFLRKAVTLALIDYRIHKFSGKCSTPKWLSLLGSLWTNIHRELCCHKVDQKDMERLTRGVEYSEIEKELDFLHRHGKQLKDADNYTRFLVTGNPTDALKPFISKSLHIKANYTETHPSASKVIRDILPETHSETPSAPTKEEYYEIVRGVVSCILALTPECQSLRNMQFATPLNDDITQVNTSVNTSAQALAFLATGQLENPALFSSNELVKLQAKRKGLFTDQELFVLRLVLVPTTDTSSTTSEVNLSEISRGDLVKSFFLNAEDLSKFRELKRQLNSPTSSSGSAEISQNLKDYDNKAYRALRAARLSAHQKLKEALVSLGYSPDQGASEITANDYDPECVSEDTV